MTQSEFDRLHKKARAQFPRLSQAAQKEIHAAYKKAGQAVSMKIRSSVINELPGSLTGELKKGSQLIFDEIKKSIPPVIKNSVDLTAKIHTQYLSDAIAATDAGLSTAKISKIYTGINNTLVRDVVSRVSQTGYTFSQRIWATADKFPKQINAVVSSGIAQGRDVLKIAKDLEVYLKNGKKGILQRYGNLERGSAAFIRRIEENVSWRALRLARSELYISLQNSALAHASANPATINFYDWILNSERGSTGCSCDEISKNSPYKLASVPGYPHPNCRCTIQARLRDSKKFNADLKKWAAGEDVGYLDKWHEKFYK